MWVCLIHFFFLQDKDPRSLFEMTCLILFHGLTKNSWNKKEQRKIKGILATPPPKPPIPEIRPY